MRNIVGSEVSRAKYWRSSFFPTISVDDFPLPSTAVKVTAGFAKPYLAKLSGVSLAMAVIFAGQGIASFQESGVIRTTFVDYVPTIQVLGLFPTVQTLAAQAVMLGLAALALFAPAGPRKRHHGDAPAAAGSSSAANNPGAAGGKVTARIA